MKALSFCRFLTIRVVEAQASPPSAAEAPAEVKVRGLLLSRNDH